MQIQQTIKEMIWKGILMPGDRLYEAQLAKQFETSRSPVREAFRALINEGLLVIDEKSQITVYKPSLGDVRDIYECRLALESRAVSIAAQCATDLQLERLSNTLKETCKAIERKEKEKIVQYNVCFHEQIINICGNLRLKKLIDDLHSLTYFYRVLNVKESGRAALILKEHTEIFNAIKNRNPEKACKKLIKHTKNDLENLINLIEK
ncbi:GntR family transcriptional regulator [Bacillus sp. ISL-47]|nr:GntR family transcriptional regulator [Bacillus sp. ISL-47]